MGFMSIIETGPLGQSIKDFASATGCDPRAVASVAALFSLSSTYEGIADILERDLNEEQNNPLAAAMKDAVGSKGPAEQPGSTTYPKNYGEQQPAELQGKQVGEKEIQTTSGESKTLYTAVNGTPVGVPGTYWKYYNKEEKKVIVPVRRYTNDPKIPGITENIALNKGGSGVVGPDGQEILKRKTFIHQARQSFTVRKGIKKYQAGDRLDRLSKSVQLAADYAAKKVRDISQISAASQPAGRSNTENV